MKQKVGRRMARPHGLLVDANHTPLKGGNNTKCDINGGVPDRWVVAGPRLWCYLVPPVVHDETQRVRQWRILTVNATGWGSLLAQLEALNLDLHPPDVLCVQEHHRLAYQIPESVSQLAALGWKAHMAAATPSSVSPTHSSGGTAVLTRTHIGMANLIGPSHPSLDGRVAAVLLHGILRHGILVASVYLDVRHSAAQLLEELEHLGAWLRGQKHAFIIAGDFNAEPHCISQIKWPEAVNGHLVTSRTPTCTTGRELDYFVLHTALFVRRPLALAYGLSCVKPHTAVVCSLAGIGAHDVVRVPRRKKAFAEEGLVGPAPFIQDPVWSEGRITNVEVAWQDWSLQAERYLCALDGLPCDAAHIGRGRGLKVRHMPLHKFVWSSAPQRISLVAKAWRRLRWCFTMLSSASPLCWLGDCEWSKHVPEFAFFGTWWQTHHIVYEVVYGTSPWDTIVYEAVQTRARMEWAASAVSSVKAWRLWASHIVAQNLSEVYKWLRKGDAAGRSPDPMVNGLPQAGHTGMLAATSEWWEEWSKHAGEPGR
eukprot:4746825-Amphidinium_carterae.1